MSPTATRIASAFRHRIAPSRRWPVGLPGRLASPRTRRRCSENCSCSRPPTPAGLAKSAGADTYCPDYRFLDAAQVRACHAAGVRVLPWTVNDEADWLRLLDWGVDGITTDYPDRLAEVLRRRGIAF